MTPKRVQRQRTKGWRMPENAVYVGRGTKWGNPWRVGDPVIIWDGITKQHLRPSARVACDLYRIWITNVSVGDEPCDASRMMWDDLRGKDLACWCPLDQPCHADVLLDLANQEHQ